MHACQTDAGPRLGCHLSLGRKPEVSIGEARAQGVECIQIFASSPGAWKPPVVRPEESARSLAARRSQGIDPLFIHAIYLINLASTDHMLRARSRSSLVATLHAGEAMEASGMVTHIGSHGGRGFVAVRDIVAAGLREVLANTEDSIDLVLENSAGAGGTLGSTLEELAALLDATGGHPRLKIALDTAHLCGAGWDFSDPATAVRLVSEVQTLIGLDRLVLLHANDSKTPCGSHRDRHAVIGEGHIGREGFQQLLAQPELRRIPWILETPDLDTRLSPEQRFVSIHALRSLMDSVESLSAAADVFPRSTAPQGDMPCTDIRIGGMVEQLVVPSKGAEGC